jgi:magnesium transporter
MRGRGRAPKIKKRSPAGAPPGQVHGQIHSSPLKVTYTRFNAKDIVTTELDHNLHSLQDQVTKHEDQIHWLHVQGKPDSRFINLLENIFPLHRLALEDVLDSNQRAKTETYGETLYIVCGFAVSGEPLLIEQFNLFIGNHFVVTIQANDLSAFSPIYKRMKSDKSRLRSSGAGYLAYSIVDIIVDRYFPILETYGDHIDRIEAKLLDQGHQISLIHEIYGVKSDLMLLRRHIVAHRELLTVLTREGRHHFNQMQWYLRDCLDHTMQQLDLIDVYREMGLYLTDLSFNLANIKANEVMKVLTVIASIFIPLTFLTGLYGMNFDTSLPGNMPELKLPYAYPIAVSGMLLTAIGLFSYFKKREWI